MSARQGLRVVVPPLDVDVDGVTCTILEVSRHEWVDGREHYIVSVVCRYDGRRTNVFQLDVTSNDELLAKLRVEVAKLKIAGLLGYAPLVLP
jgi:hypothetical protein